MTTQDVVTRDEAGVAAFGHGSTESMAVRLSEMRDQMALVKSFFGDVMTPNEDYGVIPGTKKPTLLKPGAEKLCELYGFTIIVRETHIEKDIESGYYEATVTIALRRRSDDVTVAEGVGMATTYESHYRWRWLYEDKLPRGVDKNSLFSQQRGKSTVYRMPNDDPHALWNTVLKMAKKRALVDATLAATRSSGLFTQDVEDLKGWADSDQPANGTADRDLSSGDALAPAMVPWHVSELGALLKAHQATVKDLEWVVEAELPKDSLVADLTAWLADDGKRTLEGLVVAAAQLKERRARIAAGIPCTGCGEKATRYLGDEPLCEACLAHPPTVIDQVEQGEAPAEAEETAPTEPEMLPGVAGAGSALALPDGGVNWKYFWKTTKTLGYKDAEVHTVAGSASISEWEFPDAQELLARLRGLKLEPPPATAPLDGDACAFPTCYATATRFVNGEPCCGDDSHVLTPAGVAK